MLSVGYQQADPVFQGDRDFGAFQFSSFSGGVGGSGTSVPSRFSGTRPLNAAGVPNTIPATFDPVTGLLVTANGGANNGGVRQINAAGQAVGTFHLFNFNPFNLYQTPFTRYNIFGAARVRSQRRLRSLFARALLEEHRLDDHRAVGIVRRGGDDPAQQSLSARRAPQPVLRLQRGTRRRAARCSMPAVRRSPAGRSATRRASPRPNARRRSSRPIPSDPAYRTVTATLNRRLVEGAVRQSEFTTQLFDYRVGVRGSHHRCREV